MPTITLAAPRPPTTGAANKAAPIVIGLGEAASPFAAILDGTAPDVTVAPGTVPVAGRQPVAVCGIALPPAAVPAVVVPAAVPTVPVAKTADAPTDAADDDDEADAPEPVIGVVMALPLPIALPVVERAAVGVKPSAPPSITVAVAIAPAIPDARPVAIASDPPPPAAVVPSPPQVGRDMQWSVVVPPAPTPAPTPTRNLTPKPTSMPEATVVIEPRAAPVTAAVAMPLPQIVAGPALQVFGAAMSAAVLTRKREPSLDLAAPDATIAPAAAAPLAAFAVATAGQPSLDLRQDRWPHAMVTHIEQLRDAADATDTRIRLIPDALGTIEVAVKRDGDTVHVHFSAEQAATRALLLDAQPRLAAIAEERGLRLGQTAVDGGAAQQRQPHAPQRDATTSATPRRAATTDDTDAADTGRLA